MHINTHTHTHGRHCSMTAFHPFRFLSLYFLLVLSFSASETLFQLSPSLSSASAATLDFHGRCFSSSLSRVLPCALTLSLSRARCQSPLLVDVAQSRFPLSFPPPPHTRSFLLCPHTHTHIHTHALHLSPLTMPGVSPRSASHGSPVLPCPSLSCSLHLPLHPSLSFTHTHTHTHSRCTLSHSTSLSHLIPPTRCFL